MIVFTLFGTRIKLRFDFFAAAALMSAVSAGSGAALGLLCCLLHEAGHIAAMHLFGAKPSALLFYGAGIMITPDRRRLLPVHREALILSAGCAVNFALYGISSAIGRGSGFFALANLFLGIFNLLPSEGLDGGRLLKLFLGEFLPPVWTADICRLTGCVSAVLLSGTMYLLGVRNITAYTAAALMMISSLFT